MVHDLLARIVRRLPSRFKYRLNNLRSPYVWLLRLGGSNRLVKTSAGNFFWPIDGYTSQKHLLGEYEPYMQEALSRLTQAGDVVFDVGANAGFHTLFSSLLVGPRGAVISFEPGPDVYRSLQRRIEANPGASVTPFRLALSDRCEYGRLDTSAGHSQSVVRDSGAAEVELATLDSLVEGGRAPAPDVIKIDVEGHELEVLRGAARTLAERRPVVVCDQNDGATMSNIEEYLRPLGYVVTPGPPIVAVHGRQGGDSPAESPRRGGLEG